MGKHFDDITEQWFKEHPGAETTVMSCDKCGLSYKPSLGHDCKKKVKETPTTEPVRAILCRGKTKAIAGSPYNNGKPDGEWVKGYLYNDVGCWKIRQFEITHADYISYEVDPQTIGQFTGLTDKKGIDIVDGDIVKYTPRRDCEILYEVIWQQEMSRFTLRRISNHSFKLHEWLDKDKANYCCEVVGNVHDNPELLK